MSEQVWIIDFGSQYTQLITRKCRELGHSSKIFTVTEAKHLIEKGNKAEAVILSGGPHSIFKDQGEYDFDFRDSARPILGICYGMQLLSQFFGGVVEQGSQGEYGKALVNLQTNSESLPKKTIAWMSHFDEVTKLPENFEPLYKSENGLNAGIKHQTKPMMGLQFHPEVEHTENGKEILAYFLHKMAKLTPDWNESLMVSQAREEIKTVDNSYVLCAFSGGVDSLVAATLSHEILQEKLKCFFVDNGLLRPQDMIHMRRIQDQGNLDITILDCKSLFLDALQGVKDPEKKRKIIGTKFIEVFEKEVRQYEKNKNIKFDYLLQGTLYPDVIESLSPHKTGGKSATIKSHHNVGGLPERMNLKLLEPLKYMFKDEVRKIGKSLGLPSKWVNRHPFPGPGIGVRVLGELTSEAIRCVQESDQILFEELESADLYDSTWQAFTVYLPVKTVGVKGDARAYESVICLRMVGSVDGMTADVTQVPFEFLSKVSSRITNEVSGITRVVYDITSKPPGTIEWE